MRPHLVWRRTKAAFFIEPKSWISLRLVFPRLLPLFETFLCLLRFNTLWFSPLIWSEACCKSCDIMRVDFSSGRRFSPSGSGLSWKRELSIQCCSVQHSIPMFRAACWSVGPRVMCRVRHALDDLSAILSQNSKSFFIFNRKYICAAFFFDKCRLLYFFLINFLYPIQFWEAICGQPAARMWVHRPGTLRDDCGESHVLRQHFLPLAASETYKSIHKIE